MPTENVIEPIPEESTETEITELRETIQLAELMVGESDRGKKIIARLKVRLAAALGIGRANDSVQDTNAKLAAFYRQQGRGNARNEQLNAEYAKRLGRQIQR